MEFHAQITEIKYEILHNKNHQKHADFMRDQEYLIPMWEGWDMGGVFLGQQRYQLQIPV